MIWHIDEKLFLSHEGYDRQSDLQRRWVRQNVRSNDAFAYAQ